MNSGAFRRFRSTANRHHVRRADHRVASETTARGRLADRSRFRNRIKLIRFVGQGESNETLARSADYWPHSLVFGFSVVAGEGRAAFVPRDPSLRESFLLSRVRTGVRTAFVFQR